MNRWTVYSHIKMNQGRVTETELHNLFPVNDPNARQEIAEGIVEYEIVSRRDPLVYRPLQIVEERLG